MTIPVRQFGPATAVHAGGEDGPGFDVQQTYWGYILTEGGVTPAGLWLARGLGWLVATAALVAALGLWAVPPAFLPMDPVIGRGGVSSVLGGLAILLLWLTLRDARPEVQVDLRLREVREVLRSSDGSARLLTRWSFDDVGGVHIARPTRPRSPAHLCLRWRNTGQTLAIAAGSRRSLEALRDRVGVDLQARSL